MPARGAVLEVRIRSKFFGDAAGVPRAILRDIAFTAEPGEVLALVGPSGIGKSTVLRIALGLDRDFGGSIHLRPARLGVMFQEPRLLPWLTVAENLRLVQTGRARRSEVAALLQDALLPAIGNLLPSQLSLGMARRVAFARALAADPDMLVLDEPFASLDRGLATALGARIADRARRHDTLVLLSTHDLDAGLSVAGRILVLAGAPATLAADIAVPPPEDAAGHARLREDLLMRFAFLGAERSAGAGFTQAAENNGLRDQTPA